MTPPHEPSIGLFLRIRPIASAENAIVITRNAAINVLIILNYTIHWKTLISIHYQAQLPTLRLYCAR
jgi:hypothetical protein